MSSKIIQQGAEAIIYLDKSKITKSRIKKSYRFSFLDEKIRKKRTKSEFKILEKSKLLIPVPNLISTDNKSIIEMEFISGNKLSESLDSIPHQKKICKKIGEQIALLHNKNIIHGDLTTSNMILQEKTNKLYFIDFGLSYISLKDEDKAVDLHLIKQALEAKHFSNFKSFFSLVIGGYISLATNGEQVLKRLEKVESRGRYKSKNQNG